MGKQPQQNSPQQPVPAAAVTTPLTGHQPVSVRGIFTTQEWIAALLAFLVAGLTFFRFMTPEVTLQDSGELVTGSFNFGVPHPTGYPLWAFLGWVWSRIIPFGNPAWRICLMSVLTGAAIVGILTLLMSRSILMLIRNSPWADRVEESLKEWLSLTIGTATALLFGFNRGVWLWASVPEMRVLNVFSFIAVSCLFFAWMMRPDKHRLLYATLLVFGLSLTNHQTIVVMVVPLLAGAFAVGILGDDNKAARFSGFFEMCFALLVAWAIVVTTNGWLLSGPTDSLFDQKVKALFLFGPVLPVILLFVVSAGLAAALFVVGPQFDLLDRKRALWCAGLFILGCSFYLYMPLASSTNPPMNWGFCSTKQGFLHSITRGQYEQLHMSSPLSNEFWLQVYLFTAALINQYSWPIALFAIVPVIVGIGYWNKIKPRGHQWLAYVAVAFLTACFGLLMIINPGLDKTQQEINLKFFAPAHGFFAMLIGYGMAYVAVMAVAMWPSLPRIPLRAGSLALISLALIPFNKNWETCEQRNHDFGYQFGYRMFYPGGDYPPMDRDAFLFGGTDPGRFVPTYMIFSESAVSKENKFRDPNFQQDELNFDRRDVYIVTQNALADTTYMSYIRDHYDYSRPTNYNWFSRWLGRHYTYPKEPLWIPTPDDSQRAFQEYVADVQARQARSEPMDPDEQVDVNNGRVQVRGVKGVMKINGILCKWIHDKNKAKHTFYVEESYVIDWMFPYLEPYGIIMKINKEPLPTAQADPALWNAMIKRDTAYWDKLVAEFTNRKEFWRDNDARKTFSKLRSAIGGIYAYRKLYTQALYAFEQSLALCPDSPEANFRLSQLLLETGQADKAIAVLTKYHDLDQYNDKILRAIDQIKGLQQQSLTVQQLEQSRSKDPHNLQTVGQLAQIYLRSGQFDRIPPMFNDFLAQPGVTAAEMLQIAQFYLSINRPEYALNTVEEAGRRFPQDSEALYALAIVRGAVGKNAEAINALERAIHLNPAIRERARGDKNLTSLRADVRFMSLLTQPEQK